MKTISLRVASVLTLMLALAHTRGFATPGHDAAQFATHKVMAANAFHLMNATRTYWDLYIGFGLIISALMIMQAALLWFVADAEKQRPGENKALIATLLVGNLAVFGLDARYLFIAPVVSTGLIVLAIGVALLPLGARTRSAEANLA